MTTDAHAERSDRPPTVMPTAAGEATAGSASQAAPLVDTRRVQGRRKLRFANFDEVVADAQQAHQRGYRPLGNWSLGQTLKHLGLAMHASVEGGTFSVPWWLKVVGRTLLRPYMLHLSFPAGFRLPRRAAQRLVPDETSYEEGFATLQSGIGRLASETQRGSHPVIGRLSVADWNRFHLRHAEMHLSFFVPPDSASD